MIKATIEFKVKDTPANREAVEDNLIEFLGNCPWECDHKVQGVIEEEHEPKNLIAEKVVKILSDTLGDDNWDFDIHCDKLGYKITPEAIGTDIFHIAVVHIMMEDGCVSVWLHDNMADARKTYATLDEEGCSDDHDELLIIDLKKMKKLNVRKTYAIT